MPFECIGNGALDARLNLRLTIQEKELLSLDADLASLSMSELVRRRYFGRPIVADEKAVILKELRRLGVQLKSLQGMPASEIQEDAGHVLTALKKYLDVLSRDR
ncbi:MobB mobilization protein [uncultured Deefgea sp.]|uniref:plasmid mobilization protein n=1 Tax=uncultured Deefgea sp. TaxID=1304914 RepID=UPI002626734D|nr:MobB mobilization protein [uncultured Deefgea sp.]